MYYNNSVSQVVKYALCCSTPTLTSLPPHTIWVALPTTPPSRCVWECRRNNYWVNCISDTRSGSRSNSATALQLSLAIINIFFKYFWIGVVVLDKFCVADNVQKWNTSFALLLHLVLRERKRREKKTVDELSMHPQCFPTSFSFHKVKRNVTEAGFNPTQSPWDAGFQGYHQACQLVAYSWT